LGKALALIGAGKAGNADGRNLVVQQQREVGCRQGPLGGV